MIKKAKQLLINSLINKSDIVVFDGKRYFLRYAKKVINETLGIAIELIKGQIVVGGGTVFIVNNPFSDFNFHHQVIDKNGQIVKSSFLGRTVSNNAVFLLNNVNSAHDREYVLLISRYLSC